MRYLGNICIEKTFFIKKQARCTPPNGIMFVFEMNEISTIPNYICHL
jgi:hypothetical protein